ncbi:MAG TPA: Lrp/AsnC family transcriptional regulator [Kiloniellales bacterium]|nr:Lrp/AsnC family transcriptional regulator [Kiloniellales bacterium]
MNPLDDVDRHILRVLRRNARISNAALAEEVGLSPSACLRRVRILEQEGVIRGYTAIIGRSAEDEGIAVIIQITLERQTEEYFRRFEAAVRRFAEIRECYLMTGVADYLLRVNVEQGDDFERIHKDILSVLPGVSRIHSNFSIRNVLAHR